MLAGFTYGNWSGTSAGSSDFAAVKLDSTGTEVWRWQVSHAVYLAHRRRIEFAPIILRAVCVGVFSSHSFWTSSSLDVPAGVTQEEGHTEFLIHLLSAVRALIFLARRYQPFLSLVDREVEFCVLTI